MSRLFRSSLFFAAFLGLVLAAPVAASPAAWTSPVQVLTGTFFQVSSAVDSTNHVHIAAAGRNGLWYITNRTGTWVATRILTNPINKTYFEPSLALDSNDRVFIAFSRRSCNDCTPGSTDGIFMLTDKGRTRGTFATVPTMIAPATSGEPSLAVGFGHIYFAYQEPCCQPGPLPPLWFKTNASGVWTVRQVAAAGDAPSLRLGSDGHVRVAYTKPSGIGFATATTAIGSFNHVTLPGTNSSDSAPVLALASTTRPHVAWIHRNTTLTQTVKYAVRTSGVWSSPINVATSASLAGIALTLDSVGRAEVAIGTDPGNVRVAHRVSGVWVFSVVSAAAPFVVTISRGSAGGLAVVYSRDGGGIFVSTS